MADTPECSKDTSSHSRRPPRMPSRAALESVAAMFGAMGDPERLRLLLVLAEGERCVTELAEAEGQKVTTVSARLKLLHGLRLVAKRREARHIYYRLDDHHVLQLLRGALEHAEEPGSTDSPTATPATDGGKEPAA